MTPTLATSVLTRAIAHLVAHLEGLEPRLDAGEDVWPAYLQTLHTLTAVLAAASPEATGRYLTTAELAAQLGVSPKTVLRRKKAGLLRPAATLGKRGPTALRWRP